MPDMFDNLWKPIKLQVSELGKKDIEDYRRRCNWVDDLLQKKLESGKVNPEFRKSMEDAKKSIEKGNL